MRRQFERVTCPNCRRVVSAYVPHLGDGSDVRIVSHNMKPGMLCAASTELLGEYKALRELLVKHLSGGQP